MKQDLETGNYIGKGEMASLNILKHLTGLQQRGLKHLPFVNGLYQQVPITWILSKDEVKELSEAHKKGSIDILIKLEQTIIAVRIQGKGHGSGLKGIGKAQHDKVQKQMLENHCKVVDVNWYHCRNIFKERVNGLAIQEMIDSFKEAHVMLPSVSKV